MLLDRSLGFQLMLQNKVLVYMYAYVNLIMSCDFIFILKCLHHSLFIITLDGALKSYDFSEPHNDEGAEQRNKIKMHGRHKSIALYWLIGYCFVTRHNILNRTSPGYLNTIIKNVNINVSTCRIYEIYSH